MAVSYMYIYYVWNKDYITDIASHVTNHDSHMTNLALADIDVGFFGPVATQLLQLLQSFLHTQYSRDIQNK